MNLKAPNTEKQEPEDSTNIVKQFVKDNYMYFLKELGAKAGPGN